MCGVWGNLRLVPGIGMHLHDLHIRRTRYPVWHTIIPTPGDSLKDRKCDNETQKNVEPTRRKTAKGNKF